MKRREEESRTLRKELLIISYNYRGLKGVRGYSETSFLIIKRVKIGGLRKIY